MKYIYAIDENRVYEAEYREDGWWHGRELDPKPGHGTASRAFPGGRRDYFRIIPESVARKIAGMGRNGVTAYFIDLSSSKRSAAERGGRHRNE